jgi:hypothetical protein
MATGKLLINPPILMRLSWKVRGKFANLPPRYVSKLKTHPKSKFGLPAGKGPSPALETVKSHRSPSYAKESDRYNFLVFYFALFQRQKFHRVPTRRFRGSNFRRLRVLTLSNLPHETGRARSPAPILNTIDYQIIQLIFLVSAVASGVRWGFFTNPTLITVFQSNVSWLSRIQ